MVSIKRIENILGKTLSGNARKKFVIATEISALKQAEKLLRMELNALENEHQTKMESVADLATK